GVEACRKRALAGGGQVKRRDKGGEQADIAGANLGRANAELRRRFQSEREHFGIGSRFVLPTERLDADLEKFRGRALAVAKYRADVAKTGRLAGSGGLQISARDRNREIRPQAHFTALRIRRQKHPAANVLAGKIEERFCRLEHRRIDPDIAGARVRTDERLRPRVRTILCRARPVAHTNRPRNSDSGRRSEPSPRPRAVVSLHRVVTPARGFSTTSVFFR